MTDLEAIQNYAAARSYCDFFRNRPLPWIFESDPGIVARIRERDQKRIQKAEQELHQAEAAIDRLPRLEWREAMVNRYFLLRDHLATAEAMNYSERSVRRFEAEAIKYLNAWKN